MLATSAIVEAVAAAIAELDLPLVVVDPVLVSSSGKRLLDADGVQAMCLELLPRARVRHAEHPGSRSAQRPAHRVAAMMRVRRRGGFTAWARRPSSSPAGMDHRGHGPGPRMRARSWTCCSMGANFRVSRRRGSSRGRRTGPGARSRRRLRPAWRSAARRRGGGPRSAIRRGRDRPRARDRPRPRPARSFLGMAG